MYLLFSPLADDGLVCVIEVITSFVVIGSTLIVSNNLTPPTTPPSTGEQPSNYI